MEFMTLLNHFSGVDEHADGGYVALCPAHSDSDPSLRIWRGDDNKARIHCRAGCDTPSVVYAARLSMGQLFNVTGPGTTVPRERPQMVGTGAVAALRVWLDGLTPVKAHTTAWNYVGQRFGLTAVDCERLGLRFADSAAPTLPGRPPFVSQSFARFPRLVVPLNGFDGVTRGAQGRDLSGECPGRWLSLSNPEGGAQRWAPYGVFRGEAGYEPIIITEGPGDALTATALGYDTVAVRGASLAASPELVKEIADGVAGRQVIVSGDADAAGQRFNRVLAEGLHEHGVAVHQLQIAEGGDLTAWRESDPASFPRAFHAAIKAARPLRDAASEDRARVRSDVAQRTGTVAVNSDQGADAARILADLVDTYGESDAMNAHALVAWTDGRIKYADGLGYFVWDGRTWVRSATRVRQEIHAMGAALVLAGRLPESKGFTMTTRIDSLLTELRSVPSVYVDAEEFDARPHLLSFRNGVVDLRTGKPRAHAKDDMLTVSLPFDYDADAQAPRWEQFLTEVFPDNANLVDYIQRLVGYGITGSTSEQCFAVLWGKGANGKSVFTETLTDVFGRIVKTTPFATFEDKGSGGGIPNDLAALRGARLVMASEGESGKPMSEAVLKRVTGKDKVTARFLRQEFFTFAPTFLIMLATNHKPKFKSQDEGLWRRVKLIPFARYFAPHERDYELDAKLRAEAAGIVAWAVRGAVRWYAEGLRDPECITNATREYRQTSDTLAGFYPGALVADADSKVSGNEAYTAYRDWCEAEGLKLSETWSRQMFYSAMEERGISRKKTNKGVALVGVRLVDPNVVEGPGIFGKDA